jgi:hypothetical protein
MPDSGGAAAAEAAGEGGEPQEATAADADAVASLVVLEFPGLKTVLYEGLCYSWSFMGGNRPCCPCTPAARGLPRRIRVTCHVSSVLRMQTTSL